MTKWLERAQSVFQKTDETPTPERLQEAISPGIRVISSGLAPLQNSAGRVVQTRRLTEIKSAPVIPVSPELESLIRKAAAHYDCPHDELELMLEAARNDPEGALTYYQQFGTLPEPDPHAEARQRKVEVETLQ
jgi:hypothetical protein